MTEIPGIPPRDRPADPTDPAGGAPQEAKPDKRRARTILRAVVGVVVALVAYFGVRAVLDQFGNDLGTAEVGDCVDQVDNVDDTKVVGCDSDEASMRVIGINADWSESDFDAATLDEVCEGYTVPPGGGAIWRGEDSSDGSGNGDVYCLEPTG